MITTGPLPPNPSELLGRSGCGSILERLAGAADLVIIDSPPLQAVTDAAILAVHHRWDAARDRRRPDPPRRRPERSRGAGQGRMPGRWASPSTGCRSGPRGGHTYYDYYGGYGAGADAKAGHDSVGTPRPRTPTRAGDRSARTGRPPCGC